MNKTSETQWARKLKKSLAKKTCEIKRIKIFFREIAFLAVINFFLVKEIDFWLFLKLQKNEFQSKKFFREINLFDFTSFFGQDVF